MRSKSIAKAIQSGRSQGRQELAFAKAARQNEGFKRQRDLAAAFKVASGVIEGLQMLIDMPGSKFVFCALEEGDRARIHTNIPLEGCENGARLSIIARADGHIGAIGDSFADDSDAIGAEKTDPKASEKVIAFVAKYAAVRGLIP